MATTPAASSAIPPSPLPDSPSTALHSSASPDNDDQTMTDDVRVAVSALGLMRDGSLGAGADPNLPPLPHYPPEPSTSLSKAPARSNPSTTHHSRAASSSYRSDPPRSTSTASTASASEAWTSAADTSETGLSSPVGTASVAGTLEDAEMGDKLFARALEGGEEHAGQGDPRFMARVSQLPYVSGGIEWYERSKASSRVVKLGAGLVESSFSAVSRPVSGPLGSLDDFACRQLDRIGAGGASPGRKSPTSTSRQQVQLEQDARGRSPPPSSSSVHPDGSGYVQQRPSLSQQRGSSSGSGGGAGQVVAQRSRWQTVLVEAGGLGAAVSEESLKSLRYCLQWLLYATAHLDHQISTLRDFILSLRAHNRQSSSPSSNALVAASASAHLSQIKHDVVETIRKVVEVVSKYAGAALPEQAKRYVRQSILGLPVKWASAIEQRAPGGGASASANGGRTRERSGSWSGISVGTSAGGGGREDDFATTRPERMHESYFPGSSFSSAGAGANGGENGKANGLGQETGAEDPELSPTEEAADRVLTFAVESLEMLRTVTSIFGESVEKAEAWIERLRIVGLDRQRQREAAAAAAAAAGQTSHPPSASYALPPSSVSSPTLSTSGATFDDSHSSPATGSPVESVAGTKRRRPSATNSAAGTTTGTDVGGSGGGHTTDGEGEGLGRRKRAGGRREPIAMPTEGST
ncbi:hypothetical protein JCM10213_006987 [Rhodosporidiobolus nylandii]